jgi:argininosuccinate synthase
MVENRLVGMKSRGVYETPGGTIMFTAVRVFSLTLDHEAMQLKDINALKYAELVYTGKWFDPTRKSIDGLMEKITESTTGSVRLKLYKGSVIVASRKSHNSIYVPNISSFNLRIAARPVYDQAHACYWVYRDCWSSNKDSVNA